MASSMLLSIWASIPDAICVIYAGCGKKPGHNVHNVNTSLFAKVN